MAGTFSNPERVIDALELPEGAQVADFGSGSGYFTILIAQHIGERGRVNAIDVLPSALEVIEGKARDNGITTIRTIRSNLEAPQGSTLPDNSQDVVLLANILFQSQKKDVILREAHRVLRPGGRTIIIDWIPQTLFGPEEEGWKFSLTEGTALAEKAGFSFVRKVPVSINHWGAEYTKH